MQTRKKVLWNGEVSYLLTGFGTYTYEVLSRLYATGKYDLAEFATYGLINDPRDSIIKWKYYANCVNEQDSRYTKYKSNPLNQFGQWRFERVLLDHRPEICINVRDISMMSYEPDSPYRDFFRLAWSPTIDSSPVITDWLNLLTSIDDVYTYSEWNYDILKRECPSIKLRGVATPGVDLNIFHPTNNIQKHREKMGIQPDIFLIGTVMRNQRRKLYPDLFATFRRYLDLCIEQGKPELAAKTYLYVHSSYPDVGWNIPQILKKYGLGHKVLFTYVCRYCQKPFCSFFQDARTTCPHCNNVAAVLPSVSQGLSREQLADIYRMFDLYVQYVTNEGAGMPISEAAACGVHVMGTNYSAVIDGIRKTGGTLLKVERMFCDVQDMAMKALPDNEDTAQKFYRFFTNTPEYRRAKSIEARSGACKYYNWDTTAKIWENYIDSVELTGLQGKWNTPPRIHNIPTSIPENLDNVSFIRWLILNIWNRPDKLYSYDAVAMLRDLNHGVVMEGNKTRKLTRQDLITAMTNRVNYNNHCEKVRCGMLPMYNDDYLDYMRLKQELQSRNT